MRLEKILVIDSDSVTAHLIKTHLAMEGYDVRVFGCREGTLRHYFETRYNVVILGCAHTKLCGLEICNQIRMFDQYTPIIMLGTGRGNGNIADAFDAGADDCIGTPISMRELSSRIKTILQLYRRAQKIVYGRIGGRRIEIDGLVIDSSLHRVTVRDVAVDLTAKEYDLLYLLASNPGKVFSRRLLLDLLWDHDSDIYEHTVNSHINRLRGKIERNPGSPQYILTEWGLGYRFNDKLNC
jgi:two-component system alkaline phosphatase synthesis response regulator PhoP